MKVTKTTGYYVEVETSSWWSTVGRLEDRLKQQHRECKNIVDQINRHVDDISEVTIEQRTETVCDICGYDLANDNDPYAEFDEDNELRTLCCGEMVDETGAKVATAPAADDVTR